MLQDIFFAFWFFVPAGVANTTPIIAAKLPILKNWNAPMDFGLTHKGKRMLGSHKTWRGIISGVVAGLAVFYIQTRITFGSTGFHDYLLHVGYFNKPLVLGGLLGLGALIGDAAKSLAKRWRNIEEGKKWFPFDQIDYIIGGCLFSLVVWILPLKIYVFIFVVWFLMHLLFSYIGYRLGFKEAPI